MFKIKLLPIGIVLASSFASLHAQADMVTDAHGNVGYDTAAECDAAVNSGNAKFYTSFTHKPSLLRKGESSVRAIKLSEAGTQYARGACDMGAAHQFNRDGVSHELQGKYIPFSPDMPVNLYSNKAGQPVRLSMKQCDNNFSGNIPRPVAAPVAAAVEAPVAVAAPAVAAAVARTGFRPYVFGTIGALRDGLKYNGNISVNDDDIDLAGQVGVGLQFNKLVGAELFYQAARRNDLQASGFTHLDQTAGSDYVNPRNRTYGARVTLGGNVSEKARLFAKVGAARVHHSGDDFLNSSTRTRLTAGIGATYALTQHLDLRADYDHYFKNGNATAAWRNADYFGLGLQYNF